VVWNQKETPGMETPTENNQINQTYVTYNNFSTERLTASQAETKTVPGTGPGANPPTPPQNYYQISIMYNYGTDTSRVNDFLIEGPEIESSAGIQSKPAQSGVGRFDHSIPCRFDLGDPDQKKFIDVMDSIYRACAYIIGTMKGAVNLRYFEAERPEGQFTNPVYRPFDKVTNQVIAGRAPSMYLKLFSRGKDAMAEQTLFTGVDGNPIPWPLLQNVEMKFIPLIHVKRIYVGSKASLQMEVQSAIVTSIRARNSASKQLATLQRLQHERPKLVDEVAGQVARLSMDRKEQLPQNNQPNNQAPPESNNQPTFAGITKTPSPSTNVPVPVIQQYPIGIPNVPLVQPNLVAPGVAMDGFTSTAPPRNNVIPAVVVPSVNNGSPQTNPVLTWN
jgi:hypothetical protein